jgi:hypothetical protein
LGWRVAIVDTADDMNDNGRQRAAQDAEDVGARAMLRCCCHHAGPSAAHHPFGCQRLICAPGRFILQNSLAKELPRSAAERASLARLSGGTGALTGHQRRRGAGPEADR